MGYLLRSEWWKWACIIFLVYTVVAGFLFPVPRLPILNETIRVLHFHVPMWFGMILLFLGSVVYAVKYLRSGNSLFDIYSFQLANMGIVFGVLGIITGMFWANYTWGEPWSNDPKQNGAAISLLIYLAYFVLRKSIVDDQQSNRISAVYNIFAFFMMVPLLFILPRLTDSLHPGNGGNPGLNALDMNSDLRKVFYVAVVGWTLLGYWITTITIRFSLIRQKIDGI